MVSTEEAKGNVSVKSAEPARLRKKSSPLKKVAMIVGGLFGLFLLVAIIVPLVVDVDKYRPTIVSKANERLNGKIELGKLGLSLWGRVKIDIDGLKLTDSAGRVVVDVKDASFNLPFLSVLLGRPEVRIQLDSPLIHVVKQKSGKLNVSTLAKPESGAVPSQGQASDAPATKPGAGGGTTEIPAIALNSRLTFLLNDAKLGYKDEITGDTYNIELNVRLEDVSPSSTMPFEITAKLDMLMQKKIKVTGPAMLRGSVKATSSGGQFERAEATADVNLDGLEITDPGLFHKAKGVALGANLAAEVAPDSFNASHIKFRLAEVTIDGKASGKTAGEVTTIDFKAHSNRIDVTKLGDLSPLVKEYNLNGLLEVAVNANGPTDRLAYGANVKFNKIVLNNEAMKQPLEVNGSLAVGTGELKDFALKLTAKDFDLALGGAMQNFMSPKFKFTLTSNNMDLDGLLKSQAAAAEKRKADAQATTANPSTAPSAAKAAPVVDYNAMFEPLRKNPVTVGAAGTFDFNLKRIKSTGVVISGMKGQLALNNLMLALKDFTMDIFDGSIKGNMSFNARTAKPEVGTNLTVSGLQTQKMVESQMPFARNTVKGVISANMNIGGAGLNQSDIIAGWKGGGTMDIKDAVFSTLDIGREVKDGLLGKLPPQLASQAKIPDSVLAKQGEYENVNVKFALATGVMNISEINGKAHPNKGLDLKGNGSVKLADYGLNLNLDIIDTYNLLQLDSKAPDQRYHHFAASPVVGGTLFNPKFDWSASISKLVQNVGKQKVLEEAQKHIPGNAGKVLGNILGGGNNNAPANNNNNQAPPPKPADAVKALKGLFGR